MLLYILLYNIGYIWTRTNIFPNCTVKRLITYNYIIFINKILKITSLLDKQKLKYKTKVNQLLPLPFLRLSRNTNVYSKKFYS